MFTCGQKQTAYLAELENYSESNLEAAEYKMRTNQSMNKTLKIYSPSPSREELKLKEKFMIIIIIIIMYWGLCRPFQSSSNALLSLDVT